MNTETLAPAASNYLNLRVEYYVSGDYRAIDRSNALADRCYGTEEQFDEVALDEQARIIANDGAPLTTR